MTLEKLSKALVAMTIAVLIALCGVLLHSTPRVHADDSDTDQNLAQIGLTIAPVNLNLVGKDLTLVGLGSFIVNAQADCNGCHTSNPTGSEYDTTKYSNNPYLLFPNSPPWKAAPEYYLGGGQNFGPAGPGLVSNTSSPYYTGSGSGPAIITRNLTPDISGLPEGGHTLGQFLTIMATGHDYDEIHLNCGTKNSEGVTITDNCYYGPPKGEVNGAVLQVMPWPNFSNMTQYQLTAIWTYLSAVPCQSDAGSPFPNLPQTCPGP